MIQKTTGIRYAKIFKVDSLYNTNVPKATKFWVKKNQGQ